MFTLRLNYRNEEYLPRTDMQRGLIFTYGVNYKHELYLPLNCSIDLVYIYLGTEIQIGFIFTMGSNYREGLYLSSV